MTHPPGPADTAPGSPDGPAASGAPVGPAASGAPGSPAATGRGAAPRTTGSRFGLVALIAGVVLLLAMGLTPTPYVIRGEGPVFNAIGQVTLTEGHDPVPVITIDGAPSYDTGTGRLDVMTVNVAGSPQRMPGWLEALTAYVTPEKDVLPIEIYYPPGQSVDDRNSENQQLMASSQAEAIAAALRHEGYEVTEAIVIADVRADGAAAGLLERGDVITAVDGAPVSSNADVTAALEGKADTPVTITVDRGGGLVEVVITPRATEVDGETRPLLGILVQGGYDVPVDVTIQLGDVGGPSAGLIFALAIVDKLTPGDLTGGHHLAGSGTIGSDGVVGPIGGIRQKLYAASDAGAEAFLAHPGNCAEAVGGGVPGDLPVYAVETLDEAITVVETIAADGDRSVLRTCEQVASA